MISERLQRMSTSVRDGEHHKYRQASAPDVHKECEQENLSWIRRTSRLTVRQCEAENVVIGPDERIVFTRTIPYVPDLYSKEQLSELYHDRVMHEMGLINNICADWGMVLASGLSGRRNAAIESKSRFSGNSAIQEFLDCVIEVIDAVLSMVKRYSREARLLKRDDIATILENVPANPAGSFHEALQCLRICHSSLWLSGHYHIGLGRLDQYLWPYLKSDLERGIISIKEAEELLAEFFISLNKDSDLYFGVQQGDNGQSIMLGGVKRDGTDAVNDLTWMALRVSRDVTMIDPKINLRVGHNTDLNLLDLAAELTRKGLGFPQYSNDDVVIPALVNHGYAIEDARDYTVAACWEYIIPGKGMEFVNIGAVSFPFAAHQGIVEGLQTGNSFEYILERVSASIKEQTEKLVSQKSNLLPFPAPLYSVFMSDCIEKGLELSHGAKYNNFGIHGAGSANAADALAAVRTFVFDEESIESKQLLNAMENDYEGYESLRQRIVEYGPKVGNDDDRADSMLTFLFESFADACEAINDNGRGGKVRPGTGSAMYYIWLAKGKKDTDIPVVGATAEGRRKGESFSSSLAPSPGIKVRGPVSVLRSFSKIDYQRIMNGGPITIELSDSVFRDADGIRKVAMFVRGFVQFGCQQLQLNTLNVETLKHAKLHPDEHRNLIVRVWGWSGYFCELEPEYQDHIIQRTIHSM